jgi:hypothetical protein
MHFRFYLLKDAKLTATPRGTEIFLVRVEVGDPPAGFL